MSFDVFVEGGTWITIDTWLQRAATLGARIELHPDFAPMDHSEWLPVKLELTRFDLFPAAKPHLAAGPWHAGFAFSLYPGPDAPLESLAAKRASLERRVAKLRSLDAPPIIVDHVLALISDLGTAPQVASFSTPGGSTTAEYVAQIIGAAAYALASNAAFSNPQGSDGDLRGDAILDVLTPTIEECFEYLNPAVRFDGWGG
jgi:hypothetical protein